MPEPYSQSTVLKPVECEISIVVEDSNFITYRLESDTLVLVVHNTDSQKLGSYDFIVQAAFKLHPTDMTPASIPFSANFSIADVPEILVESIAPIGSI